ncbi:hypothetical protein FQN52_009147 [Onygenales sp. PD_12]|nr:hypothetical protein FQN52_009147 [Onygenales sp. PD_12]
MRTFGTNINNSGRWTTVLQNKIMQATFTDSKMDQTLIIEGHTEFQSKGLPPNMSIPLKWSGVIALGFLKQGRQSFHQW